MLESPHIPVLPNEVISLLQQAQNPNPMWFLDGTAGEGGHSKLILKTFPEAKLILIDRDAVMLERAKKEIQKEIGSLANCLQIGGVLTCISFHSLEDRIVKWTFRDLKATNEFEILTKKPILPTDQEIKENRASRSAKLRGLRKIEPIKESRWEK